MSKVKSDTMGTMDVRYFNILENQLEKLEAAKAA